jgi:hypothetical protein
MDRARRRFPSLVDAIERLTGAAWSHPRPLPGAESLAVCVAFQAVQSIGELAAPGDDFRRMGRLGTGVQDK